MDTSSGRLQKFETDEAARRAGFLPVKRELTLKEQADMQIRLYAPCGCGSGKKFKFCCRQRPSANPPADGGGEKGQS